MSDDTDPPNDNEPHAQADEPHRRGIDGPGRARGRRTHRQPEPAVAGTGHE